MGKGENNTSDNGDAILKKLDQAADRLISQKNSPDAGIKPESVHTPKDDIITAQNLDDYLGKSKTISNMQVQINGISNVC
eukprot:11037691-Karenia_brevis.AAC.1